MQTQQLAHTHWQRLNVNRVGYLRPLKVSYWVQQPVQFELFSEPLFSDYLHAVLTLHTVFTFMAPSIFSGSESHAHFSRPSAVSTQAALGSLGPQRALQCAGIGHPRCTAFLLLQSHSRLPLSKSQFLVVIGARENTAAHEMCPQTESSQQQEAGTVRTTTPKDCFTDILDYARFRKVTAFTKLFKISRNIQTFLRNTLH